MTPADDGVPGALERLAIALGPRFSTTLVTQAGCRPRLSVTCRDTRAGQDILADESGWFWWPWAEQIADDPLAAAYQVIAALRSTAPAERRP